MQLVLIQNVTLSVKTCLMEEQAVSSEISCIPTFVIVFKVKTAQGATKILAVNRCSSATNFKGPDQRAYDIYPSIRQVFADVTNCGER